jgi:hypothetical protein
MTTIRIIERSFEAAPWRNRVRTAKGLAFSVGEQLMGEIFGFPAAIRTWTLLPRTVVFSAEKNLDFWHWEE